MIPAGFQFAGTRCGLKNKRNDIGLLVSDRPARAAGVLTTNQVRAACVEHTRGVLANNTLQAIVVNSGNANCCTGQQGARDTAKMAELAAVALGLVAENVAVASTGVIGQLLNMFKVEQGISDASQKLSDDPRPFMDAILTTDLVEKKAHTQMASGPRVFGVAKGSGMMQPNMATMLAFVATDAQVDHLDLDAILRRVADRSFNCMTVDGDTSTNDMFLVLANGASGIQPAEAEFEAGLEEVAVSLAKQIARDGEGATKLIEVIVRGSDDPRTIARTIANSPLVKTAMFGCDPNWGRVLMAAGRAGVEFDPTKATLTINAAEEDHILFFQGAPAPFDTKRVSSALKSDHVRIELDLGPGLEATIYTCDFGYGYVRINAEYHT
ncbi:MAG: bifunctional glutamate N-acetyltransferase/amino-acid acetyltransferase ArgJ [Fimbriimonadaceae bacterium]